jgi:acyl carrier protein
MHTVGVEAIQHWVVTQLAEQLGMEPQDINVHTSFSEYGLDSITGVSMAGDLEEWLKISLSPTLLWDCPTAATLAQYLAQSVAYHPERTVVTRYSAAVSPSPIRVTANDAAHLLAQLDTLSDQDVDTLLANLAAA